MNQEPKTNRFIIFRNWLACLLVLVGSTALGSPLKDKQKAVEKHLKSDVNFEKKVKVLLAFQKWSDQVIFSKSEKLKDDELTQIMQYSNLLKALKPQTLNSKNCKAAGNRVVDEDLTPMSEDLSAPAKQILSWLKLLCKK